MTDSGAAERRSHCSRVHRPSPRPAPAGGTDVEERDGVRYAKVAGWGQAKPYRVTLSGDERILGEFGDE